MGIWPTGFNSFPTCQQVFLPEIGQIRNTNFVVCEVNKSRL